MPLYLFKYQIWKYKFQKLAFTLKAFWSYVGIYRQVVWLKITHPNRPIIGILLAEHLGDIVAAEPIVGALQQKHPGAFICWIAKKHFHVLLENHPGIHMVIEEKNIYTSTLLGKQNPFSFFYNLHINGTRNQPYYEPIFFNPKSKELQLTVENYYSKNNLLEIFAKYAAVVIKQDQPHLYVKDAPVSLPFTGEYWVIHTKSNQTSREWKDEKWNQLIDVILDHLPIHIIEVGTNHGIPNQHPKFHSFVGKLSLLESIHVMKRAQFFIGIDSGPSHIANALQIPALLILGRYENFDRYMPFSGAYKNGKIAHIYFNKLQTAADHSVEEIWDAIEKTYLKQPAELVKS